MNTGNKILLGSTALCLSLALALGPALAFADDVDQTNTDTGHRSRNSNRVRVSTSLRERQSTRASARNSVDVMANTGKNESEENTDSGNVTSGDVEVSGVIDNFLNDGCASECDVPALANGESDTTVTQGNSVTGPDSRNSNRASIRTRVSTSERTSARVSNSIQVRANTGENESEENTIGGNVDSGDVTVTLDAVNNLN